MSATNHTTNYELPIFVGTDKPAWLVDWNGAMTAIDTAIHTAEGKADQAGTDIGGIESSISTINSTLTSINSAVSQLRIDTNANTGSINTITSLIGNGEPTTTDKTIIGAINEINARPDHGIYELWVNSAGIGSEFAGQAIEIDYDEDAYDTIFIEYEFNASESIGSKLVLFDNSTINDSVTTHSFNETSMYAETGRILCCSRTIAFSYNGSTKKLSITFGDCNYYAMTSWAAVSPQTLNSRLIPVRVLGMKHNA